MGAVILAVMLILAGVAWMAVTFVAADTIPELMLMAFGLVPSAAGVLLLVLR